MLLFGLFLGLGCTSEQPSSTASHQPQKNDAQPAKVEQKEISDQTAPKDPPNPETPPSVKVSTKGKIGGVPILPNTIILGGIKNASVLAVLNRAKPLTEACFSLAKSDLNKRQGKVAVKFYILKSGKTDKIQILSSTLRHLPTEDCLQSVVRTLEFPKLGRGSVAIVTHPFSFQDVSK